MIPSFCKLESVSPLTEKFKFKIKVDDDLMEQLNTVGLIPILLSSIPDQLPCAKCSEKRMRTSSDEISYFIQLSKYDNLEMKWKYDVDALKKMKFNKDKSFDPDNYKNYKLKFGAFLISDQLNEDLLKGSFGFIQTIFIVLQSFNNSEALYEKHKEIINDEFLHNLFILSTKKNPIALPFLHMIIVSFISKNGISDSLLMNDLTSTKDIFNNDSSKLFEMTTFPNFANELPLLFSIFSYLSQTRITELSTTKDDENKLSSLFDLYYDLDNEVFKVCSDQISKKQSKYIEGDKVKEESTFSRLFRRRSDVEEELKKKKNFRSLYLVYYYSILLNNEMNLPYPKFIFVHDWLMQHFGGFRKAIGFIDVKNYIKEKKKEDDKEIEFKSEVIENEFDLCCSYKFINIYENKQSDDEDDDDDDDDDLFEIISDSDSDIDEDENEDKDEDENNEDKDKDEDEKNEEKDEDESNEGKDKNEDEKNEDKDEDERNKNKKANDAKKKKGNKKKQKEQYKIVIHQIKDDSRVELPESGESVVVSFPIEIIVVHEKGRIRLKKKFKQGEQQ